MVIFATKTARWKNFYIKLMLFAGLNSLNGTVSGNLTLAISYQKM